MLQQTLELRHEWFSFPGIKGLKGTDGAGKGTTIVERKKKRLKLTEIGHYIA